eukprot:scaffold25100_cov68-Phaeocystis_antarctica.AAC.14
MPLLLKAADRSDHIGHLRFRTWGKVRVRVRAISPGPTTLSPHKVPHPAYPEAADRSEVMRCARESGANAFASRLRQS